MMFFVVAVVVFQILDGTFQLVKNIVSLVSTTKIRLY